MPQINGDKYSHTNTIQTKIVLATVNTMGILTGAILLGIIISAVTQ